MIETVVRMNTVVRVPTHREPTHPGEILREEFLEPMGLTQQELADGIHAPYQRVNELVNQRRRMTPSTALRLAKFFGVSPGFWLNLQLRWDLYHTQREEAAELETIQTYSFTGIAGRKKRSLEQKESGEDLADGEAPAGDDVTAF